MIVAAPLSRTESTQRFQTYRYYLRALAALTGVGHPFIDVGSVYPSLANRIAAMPSFQHRSGVVWDEQAIKRSLTNAWGTELLLLLGGEYATEDELLRITNNWAAVQLYYVFYHATQAMVIARGQERPESHPTTQKLFMDMWATRSLDCAPWTLGYRLHPINVPSGQQVVSRISTLARPRSEADYLNHVFKALSTTRNEALPQAERSKREAKRKVARTLWDREEEARISNGRRPRQAPSSSLPILTPEEKAAARANVRCYTIMDILWRLRTRTNYRDGLMFIEGPDDEAASTELNRDMRSLASTTMLLYEMYICKQIGVDAMRTLASSWIDRNTVSSGVGVGQRLSLVLARSA